MITFIGPPLLSGIGQHTKKYMDLFPNSTYKLINEDIPQSDTIFMFALPLKNYIDRIDDIKKKCKKIICMTVCETETVHEDYGLLFKKFDRIAVPSEFCKNVFSKQFPDTTFYVIHAHIPKPISKPYVFYHIGNIMDQRKNIEKLIKTFLKLDKPDTKLVIKATCIKPVNSNHPRVEIINGLVDEYDMEYIHSRCDCYVNFSHSEGVGMGAIEAAVRNKPVIITDYGGPTEYIKTPYTIKCEKTSIKNDDFLFKRGMIWGEPDEDQLLEFMKDAYEKRLNYMDHSHTITLTNRDNIIDEFVDEIVGCIDN